MNRKERFQITMRTCKLMNRYCPGLIRVILLDSIVNSLQPFVAIWFSAQILNGLVSSASAKSLMILAIAAVTTGFLFSILKSYLNALHADRQQQMWNYFSKVFTDKQMSLDYADVEDASIQQMKQREKQNLFDYGNGLGQFAFSSGGLIEGTVSIVASVALVLSLFFSKGTDSLTSSPLCMIPVFLAMIGGSIIQAIAFQKSNNTFEKWIDQTSWFNRLHVFFSGVLCTSSEKAKDIRIYRQDLVADRILSRLERHDRTEKKFFIKISAYESISAVLSGLLYCLCYLFVIVKAFFGAFAVGSVLQYVGALNRLSDGIRKLIFSDADNKLYTGYLKRMYAFLDIPNQKYQGCLPIEKRAFCKNGDNDYEIEFRHVSFRYPGTSQNALSDLSLRFRIGERMAVVGPNGSGKSTFIKLLCRLYDPTEGTILLNGIDIRKYDYQEYMSIFSVVFQDFKLFAFSLGQNVAASSHYDSEKVTNALQKAGFEDRLANMPKGLETCLYQDFDEQGVDISGGEAQKIALARALYRDSPFMILDEPTAALDPIAEYEIYSRFNDILSDKTAIYISHRLSSCRFCNDIAVFSEGRLIERGDHDALVSIPNGTYHTLWEAQAQYYR